MSSLSSPTQYYYSSPQVIQAALPQVGAPADDTTTVIASDPVLGSDQFDPNSMTPEALLTYLSTRLGSLDGQMDQIFTRERASEKVRSELRQIQELLTTLPTDANEQKGLPLDLEAFKAKLEPHLANIAAENPDLADSIRTNLESDAQILSGGNGGDDSYSTRELDATSTYLSTVSKDLESGSQMEMIQLQSLMGARQTAIQLSTNLVSALNESQKSVVSNIR
jgi:hypothetical protein